MALYKTILVEIGYIQVDLTRYLVKDKPSTNHAHTIHSGSTDHHKEPNRIWKRKSSTGGPIYAIFWLHRNRTRQIPHQPGISLSVSCWKVLWDSRLDTPQQSGLAQTTTAAPWSWASGSNWWVWRTQSLCFIGGQAKIGHHNTWMEWCWQTVFKPLGASASWASNSKFTLQTLTAIC